MVIYADILFCLNLIINYALLSITGRFCQRSPKRSKILLGALLGAVYSFILFLPANGGILWVSRLAISGLMVRLSFAYKGWFQFFKEYLAFFLISCLFGGIMLLLWLWVSPSGMLYENGIVYFHFSPVMLITFTAVSYGAAEIFSRCFQKKGVDEGVYQVIVELGQRQVLLDGFLDTGNTLRDCYSGYPVAICTMKGICGILPVGMREIFETILESEEPANWDTLLSPRVGRQFKLIPYHGVGKSGILPAFLPDRLVLCRQEERIQVENTYLAVTRQDRLMEQADILLNPGMLPLQIGQREQSRAG